MSRGEKLITSNRVQTKGQDRIDFLLRKSIPQIKIDREQCFSKKNMATRTKGFINFLIIRKIDN
jgi:hypothetical protein